MKNAMNLQQQQLKILHENSLKQNYRSINAFSVIIHTISITNHNSVLIHNKPYSAPEYGLFFIHSKSCVGCYIKLISNNNRKVTVNYEYNQDCYNRQAHAKKPQLLTILKS